MRESDLARTRFRRQGRGFRPSARALPKTSARATRHRASELSGGRRPRGQREQGLRAFSFFVSGFFFFSAKRKRKRRREAVPFLSSRLLLLSLGSISATSARRSFVPTRRVIFERDDPAFEDIPQHVRATNDTGAGALFPSAPPDRESPSPRGPPRPAPDAREPRALHAAQVLRASRARLGPEQHGGHAPARGGNDSRRARASQAERRKGLGPRRSAPWNDACAMSRGFSRSMSHDTASRRPLTGRGSNAESAAARGRADPENVGPVPGGWRRGAPATMILSRASDGHTHRDRSRTSCWKSSSFSSNAGFCRRVDPHAAASSASSSRSSVDGFFRVFETRPVHCGYFWPRIIS